ncbi:hypothetical protein Tco_0872970, partial [Tanacetum coccineum]
KRMKIFVAKIDQEKSKGGTWLGRGFKGTRKEETKDLMVYVYGLLSWESSHDIKESVF